MPQKRKRALNIPRKTTQTSQSSISTNMTEHELQHMKSCRVNLVRLPLMYECNINEEELQRMKSCKVHLERLPIVHLTEASASKRQVDAHGNVFEVVPNRPQNYNLVTDNQVAGTSRAVGTILEQTSDSQRTIVSNVVDDTPTPPTSNQPQPITSQTDVIQYTPEVSSDEENQIRHNPIARTHRAAAVADAVINEREFIRHNVGAIAGQNVCSYCNAYYFHAEKNSRTGDISLCCQRGKVQLPPYSNCPNRLYELYTQNTYEARHFRANIRHYNTGCAFASTVANYVNMGAGPHIVKVKGIVHHIMPQIQPRAGATAKFAQLYFLDTQDARNIRDVNWIECLPNVLQEIQDLIKANNPFARMYRMLREVYDAEFNRAGGQMPEITLAVAANIDEMIQQQQLDPNRYNVPAVNEIAAVFVGDAPPMNVDIRLYPHGGNPVTVRDISPLIDPLSYPLLFPCGDLGWNISMQHTGPNQTNRYTKVTCREYVCYRLGVRQPFNVLHHGGKLFLQWLVDTWVRIEGLQLHWVRENQKKIKVDEYRTLQEYVQRHADQTGERVGRSIVLPSTFVGSPRYMEQKYLDAMAIVARYGKPDLFITFTCNPTWSEIQDSIDAPQEVMHRPDIVCRVFKMKLDYLIELIEKRQYFGRVRSLLYSIEFQKRGLPHAHILINLHEEDKIREPEQVDAFIRAELPDENEEPRLYNVVTRNMIHRKCGANRPGVTCLRQGQCRFKYPKRFQENTLLAESTYAVYRRRDNGRHFIMNNDVYDNRDVVPFSPVLSLLLEAHVNVEVCTSVKATKYLYKYVHKGHDGILLDFNEGLRHVNGVVFRDEVHNYQTMRYVSSHEAYWRIVAFPLTYNNMAVFQLIIHLPGRQSVAFDEDDVGAAVAEEKETHLLAWFELNRTCPEATRYTFVQIPEHFTWQRQQRKWTKRKSHFNTIGRLPDIKPTAGELFYLRRLLGVVRGATSFEQLRIVHGQEHPTFFAACLDRHLVENDEEYTKCMQEAVVYKLPGAIRQLFLHLLLCCAVQDPVTLFTTFQNDMMADFVEQNVDNSLNQLLLYLDNALRESNRKNEDFGLMAPQPDQLWTPRGADDNIDDHVEEGLRMQQLMNNDQIQTFNAILEDLEKVLINDTAEPKLHFIDGPAGTGKTFFYNTLLHTVKAMGITPVSVAFTGIAAILLQGGVTTHTQFGLPIKLTEDASSRIKHEDKRAQELLATPIIIWDEAAMTSRYALECADRLLRTLTSVDVPFGGKVLVMGGDFRQLLPIHREGGRDQVISISLKNSPLWPLFTQHKFYVNMRADPAEREFAEYLLQIGEGNHTQVPGLPDDYFQIPNDMCVNIEELIQDIYGNDPTAFGHRDRAILTTTNAEADNINGKLLSKLPGQERRYMSVDKLVDHDHGDFYVPLDLLNSLSPPGCPPHMLALKPKAVIMLLRNIELAAGLCNGTRLEVERMDEHVLTCNILTGTRVGERVYISRHDIECDPSSTRYPFKFIRRQFPVKLSYAMTINKAQGQTLEKVGIYLPTCVFAHGQMYVALSRGRKPADVKIALKESRTQGKLSQHNGIFTRNVVYKEILEN